MRTTHLAIVFVARVVLNVSISNQDKRVNLSCLDRLALAYSFQKNMLLFYPAHISPRLMLKFFCCLLVMIAAISL